MDEDVIVAPGPIFEVPGDKEAVGFDGHVRLCFAWEDEWKLEEGVRRLGKVAKKMLNDVESGRGQDTSDGGIDVNACK